MRDDRAGVATLFVDGALAGGPTIPLDPCAEHIRARRLRAGDVLHVTNGQGVVARGPLRGSDRAGWTLDVTSRESVAAEAAPRLFAPVADRTRLLWLAEKAVEIGIESWCLVQFKRSASVTPRGEGAAFGAKIRARMIAALEQSGGAWLPRIAPDVSVEELANQTSPHRFILHPHGQALISRMQGASDPCSIALGPEGGLEGDELALLTAAGWTAVSLGSGILRFETAGIAALAIARALHHATED